MKLLSAFFFGYELDLKTQVKMATPEKALLEVFYLGFKSLPEVELPRSFNTKKALDMIKKIPHRLAVPSWRGHSNVISLLRNALLPVEKLCLFIYNDLR